MHRFARVITILSAVLGMAACQAAIQQQQEQKAAAITRDTTHPFPFIITRDFPVL